MPKFMPNITVTVHVPGQPPATARLLEFAETPQYETIFPQSEPDPNWRWIDPAGHEHTYTNPGWSVTNSREEPVEPYYCEDCREVHDTETRLVCSECSCDISPGSRPGRPHVIETGPPEIKIVLTGQLLVADGQAIRLGIEDGLPVEGHITKVEHNYDGGDIQQLTTLTGYYRGAPND